MNTNTSAYQLLTLIALSGECSTKVLSHMGISPSYGEKLITKLKDDNLIKTHYKDRLRGYRLTHIGKKKLLEENPNRFAFYFNGSSDTNRPRSDYPRRLRLQQASIVYSMLYNSGILLFRDEKAPLFQCSTTTTQSLLLPSFYHSREIKELGAETMKINNSRTIGILLAPKCIYAIFYTSDSLLKWQYRTELKVKTMLQYHISRGILSSESVHSGYHPDTPVKALFIGKDMETALKLMTSTGGYQNNYFRLDSSFDFFHYIPESSFGETMLRLLCSPQLILSLKKLLLSDLQPPCQDYGLEHDAVQNGIPVLFAFDFDMLRISRFRTALSFHELCGCLLCFDFQKEILQKYFEDNIIIETIDLNKFERRFLN